MTANRVRVPVPAETGGEDRLAGSLTFRHAAYLAAAAAGVAVMLLGDPSVGRVAVGGLVATAGVTGGLCRPYGEPLDRLLPAAIAFLARRRSRRAEPVATAPSAVAEDVPDLPTEERTRSRSRPRLDPTVVRRAVAALAVAAVAALAIGRLAHHPARPPEPRVVVVPVVVPEPDPWREVDDAIDTWLDAVLNG